MTVAAGALAYLLAHAGELAPMVGASAGISGMMGAAARFAFEPGGSLDMWHGDRTQADHVPAAPLLAALRNPRVLTFVGVWFGLNLLFGLGSLSIAGANQSGGLGGASSAAFSRACCCSRRSIRCAARRSSEDRPTYALKVCMAGVNRLCAWLAPGAGSGQEP